MTFSMKRILILLLVLAGLQTLAAPVSKKEAQQLGRTYLLKNNVIESSSTLTLADTYQQGGVECFYVFNIENIGFVLVSADDYASPILGYSMNGIFNQGNLPENLAQWLESYATAIANGVKENRQADQQTQRQWADLRKGSSEVKTATKSVSALLTSRWSQGYGYNEYCPIYEGQHVVVGCVATAMAQIMRYYAYPTHGFGSKSYVHNYYGMLSADFFNATYDFSLMPDEVSWESSNAEIDATSLFCYHCGVSVSMEYENPNHTTGSGAYMSKVAKALEHFGYYGAQLMTPDEDSVWKARLRNEIDNRRPILYSGNSAYSGGHAFVCDGYDDEDMFHFNWGWGGYGDGNYSLTTMQGFTSGHQAVLNITPSGFNSHTDVIYIASDGTGDGSSWDSANNNLEIATRYVAPELNKPIWVKAGTYYGDTTQETFIELTEGLVLYGGFAGTETADSQRDPHTNITILDGQNQQRVIYAEGAHQTIGGTTKVHGFTIQNGYADEGSALYAYGKVDCADLTIVGNHSVEEAPVLLLDYATLWRSKVIDNQCDSFPTAVFVRKCNIKQSLIASNRCGGVTLSNGATLLQSDIVENEGAGIVAKGSRSTVSGSIIWGNQQMLEHDSTNMPNFQYSAMDSDTLIAGTDNLQLSADNYGDNVLMGPQFVAVGSDWHLQQGSPCIDRGDIQTSAQSNKDLDGNYRFENGRADMGCYESNYVGISESHRNTETTVHPNPSTGLIVVNAPCNSVLQVYDSKENLLQQHNTQSGCLTLDLSAQRRGIYMIRCGESVCKVVLF